VVNIGSRQQGRLKAENVLDVVPQQQTIIEGIKRQLGHGPYQKSDIYFKEGSSREIANALATLPLYIQKKFYE